MPPLLSSFKDLYKVENLVDLVKQKSISSDLNMEGRALAKADYQINLTLVLDQIKLTIKTRIIKLEMLLSVDQDLRVLSTRSMVKLMKKE